MTKILVTYFPLRPLGFCKYGGCGWRGVSNYVLGIGFCIYAGGSKYEVDINASILLCLRLFGAARRGNGDSRDRYGHYRCLGDVRECCGRGAMCLGREDLSFGSPQGAEVHHVLLNPLHAQNA